jgi:hypothetical protein
MLCRPPNLPVQKPNSRFGGQIGLIFYNELETNCHSQVIGHLIKVNRAALFEPGRKPWRAKIGFQQVLKELCDHRRFGIAAICRLGRDVRLLRGAG